MRQPQGSRGTQGRRCPKQHAAISGNKLNNYHMNGFKGSIDVLGVLGHLPREDWQQKTWHAKASCILRFGFFFFFLFVSWHTYAELLVAVLIPSVDTGPEEMQL